MSSCSPVAVFRIDSKGMIRSWNDGAAAFFGSPYQKSLGTSGARLFSASSFSRIKSNLIKLSQGDTTVFDLQVHAKRAGGTTFPCSVTVFSMEASGPLICICRDLSVHSKREKGYLREKKLYGMLTAVAMAANESNELKEAMQICINEVCAHTRWPVGHAYVHANDGTSDMISVNAWYFSNPKKFRNFKKITESTRFPMGKGIVGRVMAEKKAVWIKDVRRDPNFVRSKIATDIGVRSGYAFPVMSYGQVIAVLEFFSVQIKEPDERLLRIMSQMGRQLGHLIERQRAEEQLIRARELALQASDAKSQFVANISHEIRTPLNAIVAMSSFLKDTALTPEQSEYVGTLNQGVESLLNLIDDVLDFSKIESGKLELETVDFDLRNLVREILDIYLFSAAERGIALTSQISEDVPSRLRGDPFRFRQVIANLVSNAIKFTAQGSVLVSVQMDENGVKPSGAGLPQARLRVEVKDTGVGIPLEVQDRLFKPFSQADGSTTRKYGGTGLGLSISKKLVESMGGEIGVISKDGQGALFWFHVPFEVPQKSDSLSNEREVSGLPLSVSPARILVAEDNRFNRKVILKMLEKLGYQAEAVVNGAECLVALERGSYDLILMDCQMPEMDGYEASARIRRLSDFAKSRIPIIALTASVVAGERERCLNSGMTDYLSKPINILDLSQRIEKNLKDQSQTLQVVNPRALNKLRSLQKPGEKDVLGEFVDLFEAIFDENYRILENAAKLNDFKALEKAAHVLKSSCANLGAEILYQKCIDLESAGRDHDVNQISVGLKELPQAYQVVKDWFKKLNKERDS